MQEREGPDLDLYETQLERIFIYYCAFGDKDSHAHLKMQNYKRLLGDIGLNSQALMARLDVIFCANSHYTIIDLNMFKKTLVDVAVFSFQGCSQGEALQILMIKHMQPLYDVVLKDTEFGQSMRYISANYLKQNAFVFLKRFQSGLQSLYKAYFTDEGESGKEEEFRMFSKLSRELTLVPRVVTRPIGYLMFSFLRERKAKTAFSTYFGYIQEHPIRQYEFSFMCFLEFVVLMSNMHFKDEQKDEVKVYKLLQLIEVSPGYQNLIKKTKVQNFFMSQQELKEIIDLNRSRYIYNPVQSRIISIKTLDNPLRRKLKSYYEPLKQKFIDLSGKKHVQKDFYLAEHKAKRLLTSVCPLVPEDVMDLILDSVDRINFDNFILLLERTAQRAGIQVREMFNRVLKYKNQRQSSGVWLLQET